MTDHRSQRRFKAARNPLCQMFKALKARKLSIAVRKMQFVNKFKSAPSVLTLLAIGICIGCPVQSPSISGSAFKATQRDPLFLLESELGSSHLLRVPFEITNETEAALRVTVRSKSCSCIDVTVPLTSVSPHSVGRGTAIFRVNHVPETGLKKAATVHLSGVGDGGLMKQARCEVAYNILPDLEIVPPYLHIALGEENERAVVVEVIRRYRTAPVAVTVPRFDFSVPELTVIATSGPDESCLASGINELKWMARILVHSELTDRELVGNAKIVFGLGPSDSVRLPFRIYRKTGLLVAPSRHWFSATVAGFESMRRSVLRANDGQAFAILKCTPSSSDWRASNSSSQAAISHAIEIWFTPTELGERNGDIEIETSHPRMRRVSIKVQGTGLGAVTETQPVILSNTQ